MYVCVSCLWIYDRCQFIIQSYNMYEYDWMCALVHWIILILIYFANFWLIYLCFNHWDRIYIYTCTLYIYIRIWNFATFWDGPMCRKLICWCLPCSICWGKYLHSLPDVWLCDFILLIDSFDALILEPEEKLIEIVTGMEQTLGAESARLW